VTATDLQNGKALAVVPTTPSGSNYTAFEIILPFQKPPPAYSFLVRTILTDLLSFNPSKSQFNFTFSPFPVTNFPVAQASLSVNVRGWSNPTASNVIGNFTNGVFTAVPGPVSPFDTRIARITFSSSGSQNILDALADRTLTIAPSGIVTVSDNYNVTNHGPSLPNIAFTLPKDVKSVSGSDAVGALDPTSIVSAGQSNTNSTWKVAPRFGSIGTNQSVVVTLHFDLPSSLVSSPSPGAYSLNYDLLDNVQFYQPVLRTKIVMPTGLRLNSLTSPVPYTVSGNQILFQASPLTPLSNLSLSMNYGLSPFWASLFQYLRHCGRDATLFIVALIGIGGLCVLAAIIQANGLQEYLIYVWPPVVIAKEEKEGGDEPVAVSVNGNPMWIPRGQLVEIPYRFYDALMKAVKTIYTQIDAAGTLQGREVPAHPIDVKWKPSDAIVAEWVEKMNTLQAPPPAPTQVAA